MTNIMKVIQSNFNIKKYYNKLNIILINYFNELFSKLNIILINHFKKLNL